MGGPARRVDGRRVRWELEQKAAALPKIRPGLRYAIVGRDTVTGGDRSLLRITAADVFAG